MNYDKKIRSTEEDNSEIKFDPAAMDLQQQIAMQLKSGKSKNPLRQLTGKWPGDESYDDLLKMLDE